MAVSTVESSTINNAVAHGTRTRSARRAGVGAKQNRWATEERRDNLKKLISHFRGVNGESSDLPELETMDIAQILKFSKSGVRKYIVELEEAGVIQSSYRRATLVKSRRPVYKLTGDEAAIATFFQTLDDPTFGARRRGSRVEQVSALHPTCKIHVLKDDAPYHVRRDLRPVTRDPMVAALFGPAPSTICGDDLIKVRA